MQSIEYQGFHGSVEYESETDTLYGKVLGISDLILYESPDGSIQGLKDGMAEMVDCYLESCREHGRQPNRGFSGDLRLRLGAELHRKAAAAALAHDQSLNSFLVHAVEKAIA